MQLMSLESKTSLSHYTILINIDAVIVIKHLWFNRMRNKIASFSWKAKRATQFHTKQKRIKANRAGGRRKKFSSQKKNGIKSEDVNQKWLGRYTGAKINCSCFCCWTTRIMFAPPFSRKRATVYKLSVSPLCGDIKITDFSIAVPKDENFSSKAIGYRKTRDE